MLLPALFAWQHPTLLLSSALQANVSKVIQTHLVRVPSSIYSAAHPPLVGVTISATGSPPALLLPGQYTSTTNPQLLHNLLVSSSASLSASPGFKNSTTSGVALPLNVAQEPGLSIYSGALYSGDPAFTSIPSAPIGANTSTSLTLRSLALSSNVYIALNSPASPNARVIVWDSIPDTAQLPTSAPSALTLFDIESTACSPSCASSGICTAAGTCACAPGFTGASCETCAAGFFGPTCAACPAGCTQCDDGLTGSGQCLDTAPPGAPASCNCVNGVCGANGTCTCTTGFTTAANGTACSQCATGFFLTTAGDCSICQIGCTACADGTGECTTCKSGFTQDANDNTKCDAPPSTTSTGTLCPNGAFADGANCTPCSSACKTCTAGTSTDCVECAAGTYLLNGACVSASATGVCAGSSLIANNDKLECDSCGAKCTSCQIPNFSAVSTVNQLQCTGCVPGFFLSGGACVESCPAGTFVNPQDNLTCIGSASFCLTCSSNQLAAAGKLRFLLRRVLHAVHILPLLQARPQQRPLPPDVRPDGVLRPQLRDVRDVRRQLRELCGRGAEPVSRVRGRGGRAKGGDLVDVANSSSISAPAPGLDTPTAAAPTTTKRPLAWWEILLMALGCAFIFLVVVWLWRRRARKQRAQCTEQFAAKRQLDPAGWRWRLLRFGEKLFGHRASRRVHVNQPPNVEGDGIKMARMRAAEEARDARDMDKLLSAYEHQYPRAHHPQHHHHHHHQHHQQARDSASDASSLSAPSLYSQFTGVPPRAPAPREPVRHERNVTSRFSAETEGDVDAYYLVPVAAPKKPFRR
ncbi:TNFR/NGFR cysteine-rich region family protein [Mycena maculata]|uniref:TNFR/NGFR cysteine-rich region family protein n=1 Tax=Mycena maculata TaxID=230809 RepID=A0AAD7IN13_9AGAR|nr:TNFR/NGFR cysteine-rich region family protein [Mycena maculata]